MLAKPIVPGLYAIPLGFVNVFLLETGSGLALVDTGTAGSGKRILKAIIELGHPISDLHAILITHLHTDHVGGLEEVRSATGARVYMHELEARDYGQGVTMRPVEPGPGLLNRLMVRAVTARPASRLANPSPVDVCLQGGEEIPEAGGVRALHTPGHTAGHLAYYWPRHGGVLIAGDIAGHIGGLTYSFLYENLDQGRRTLTALSQVGFQTACFSHGRPITKDASRQFAQRFPEGNYAK